MPVQSRRIQPSELFFWENDLRYTRESGTLENDVTTAGTADDIPVTTELLGQPLRLVSDQWQFASSAEVGSGDVDGFVVDGPVLGAALAAGEITPDKYSIIARGPALAYEGRIPATDVYGVVIVEAEYIAELEVHSIQTKKVPPVTSTQTT